MKKYMVVSCCDREISKIGTFDTKAEAIEAMRDDFMQITGVDFCEGYNEDDFSQWCFCGESAWANCPANGACDDYDWKILEV